MVQSIVNEISPLITDLNFVERYGGLVQTMEWKQQDGKVMYFPASCSVSEADCRNNQRYQDLMPDSTKASVVYFEQRTDLQDKGFISFGGVQSRTHKKFEVKLRLVCWLNLKKLGLVNCNAADSAVRSFYNILCQEIKPTDPVFPPESEIEVKAINVIKKDKSIFQPYNYPVHTFLYPYDYFAIDFTVSLVMCIGQDYTMPIGTPITCVDYSRL